MQHFRTIDHEYCFKDTYKENPNAIQVLLREDETHQTLTWFPKFAKLPTFNT